MMKANEFVHRIASMNRNADRDDPDGELDDLIVEARKILHDEQGIEMPAEVDEEEDDDG